MGNFIAYFFKDLHDFNSKVYLFNSSIVLIITAYIIVNQKFRTTFISIIYVTKHNLCNNMEGYFYPSN